ncbi:glycosyltransferase [Paenibacillus radicis (ex Xue et al. 2023)]|uniref:4,4'-diaponeurosporenoate glycosyltransferase n=1 Tax=Paenibacillus radicis (ex Xue et al. 2023) TaxID=2972489 RepID=A0ABT1YR94_9BACL|nr:glycosyltransferase family 2 protein [Paenibacillus radicis (ex Xue et al. 2023)]MCR8635255.1 glycosyltransferase family 2 protein [Paenibacillus radicis (ex Xue et al. 2023)]
MLVLKLLAIFTISYWLYMLWDTYRARELMLHLPHNKEDQEDDKALASNVVLINKARQQRQAKAGHELPLVSVIIAAKEEEASISETVKHLLNQTYPRLEIIAVNDRSQDDTGRKLEELRKWSEGRQSIPVPLRIIHVTSLPAGWIGKNHALYQGYQQARGQYVLFTDADVLFQPAAIADAVHYMKENNVDHLTLAPDMIVRSFWLRAFVQYFFFTFSLYIRPWRANIDSQHKHGMGIGAFNMMTRTAYERIGTHKAFALRPDDDLQLGIRVKQAGLRQRLASGREHIAVEWYSSLGEAVRGLEKNLFSGFHYRISLALLGVLGQLLMFFFPFLAIFLLDGWPLWLYTGAILILLVLYLRLIRYLIGHNGKEVIVLPLTVCLLCYIIIRSVWLTVRQGGIYWRGTFYPLDELKKMG